MKQIAVVSDSCLRSMRLMFELLCGLWEKLSDLCVELGSTARSRRKTQSPTERRPFLHHNSRVLPNLRSEKIIDRRSK